MIRFLEVKGLNNKLSQSFEFNEDLNIFTGPNGSGKTTLLKLIWYLISGNLERIMPEISFQYVSIDTDQFSLNITYTTPEKVSFECEFNSDKYTASSDSSIDLKSENSQQYEKDVSIVVIVDPETGFLEPNEDAIDLNTLNRRIVTQLSKSLFFPTYRRIEGGVSSSQVIRQSPNSSSFVRRVQTDRTMERLQDAMSELSSEVSVFGHKFIASISTNDIAALLTQKFVPISKRIDELQVKSFQEIDQRIKKYFEDEEESESNIFKNTRQELEHILNIVDRVTNNREELLQPFSVLSDLTRNILKYRAVHVTGQVSRGEDIEGLTLSEGTHGVTLSIVEHAISSNKLSSGEKQMLSFLCYNAFYKNTTIFIDEPELSLNVDWQRRLFPTLLDQGQSNQFFVATHSPFIYTKFPDKEFMLDDNRGES